jgi:hypothetical protein
MFSLSHYMSESRSYIFSRGIYEFLVVSRATGRQPVNGLCASNAKRCLFSLIFLHSIIVGLAMEKR